MSIISELEVGRSDGYRFIVKYMNFIPSKPKRDMVLARIGYHKGTTILDARYTEMVEGGIKLGRHLCRTTGAYARVKISEKSKSMILLENHLKFESESLCHLLENSGELVLMSATAGRTVTERVFSEMKDGDAAMAVILDCVASQTADAALDWIMQFIGKMLSREGKRFTKHRYSPGFGDLPLIYQKQIFDALQLEKLDMEVTEKYMLVPEKSVIAIAGIEDVRE